MRAASHEPIHSGAIQVGTGRGHSPPLSPVADRKSANEPLTGQIRGRGRGLRKPELNQNPEGAAMGAAVWQPGSIRLEAIGVPATSACKSRGRFQVQNSPKKTQKRPSTSLTDWVKGPHGRFVLAAAAMYCQSQWALPEAADLVIHELVSKPHAPSMASPGLQRGGARIFTYDLLLDRCD
jgi:hypothetical protein